MKALLFLVSLVFMVNTTLGQEQTIQRLSKTEVDKELAADEFLILDIRTPREFVAGHIKTAINLDFYEKDFQEKLNQLDKSKKIMIYCASGGRSQKALNQMKEMGFEYVIELEGGFRSWEN